MARNMVMPWQYRSESYKSPREVPLAVRGQVQVQVEVQSGAQVEDTLVNPIGTLQEFYRSTPGVLQDYYRSSAGVLHA